VTEKCRSTSKAINKSQSGKENSMNTSSKVWLVTGSGSGLGRNIAEAVLAAGHHLVATARDPRRLEDLVNKYGDQFAPLRST